MTEYWGFKLSILLLSTFIISTTTVAGDRRPKIKMNQSYKAEIEATFVTEKFTMAIKEFFQSAIADQPEIGSIQQTVGGIDTKIVLEYSKDKLFIVADDQCRVRNITVYLNALFNADIDPLVKYPVITSKDMMRLTQDLKWDLINKTIVIRGIQSSLWRSRLKKGVTDLTVDAYYTDGWDGEAGQKGDTPVRYDTYGTVKSKPFHVIFDYYFFEYRRQFDFDEKPGAFEMPANTFCRGSDSTAKLPGLPPAYSYTAEIVSHRLNIVEVAKVWYDGPNKLLRQDSHPPSYKLAGYPVSEIYDLKTDVVYKIDTILQTCSAESIEQDKINNDIIFDPTKTGKRVDLTLKDPVAYLRNEENKFTYIEQRIKRDIICDVYSSQHNLTLPDGKTASTLFVFYIMTDDWQLYPDIGGPAEKLTSIPVMLDVFIEDELKPGVHPEYLLDSTYNFIDFSDKVTTDMFSIPQCYSRNTEIYFKIAFPGSLIPSLTKAMHAKLQELIAITIGILPHRVQKFSLSEDSSFVYARAAITDRTKPESQFTRIKNKQLNTNQVKESFKKLTVNKCASKCISATYSCSGFDLSTDGDCRLTEALIVSSQLSTSRTINYYGRTLTGNQQVKEMSASDAWKQLTDTIYKGIFSLSLFNPATNETIVYTARTVELLFGATIVCGLLCPIDCSGSLRNRYYTLILAKSSIDVEGNPILPPQMSYRIELSLPVLKTVSFHATWYDSKRKLLRLDERFLEPKAPFYSLNPLTTINDFSEGVAYHIDQALGNCTILPLADNPVDVADHKKDTTILSMRNPDQLFKMDSKFKFFGQKTVRGILCDVYEAIRTDFTIPGTQSPSISTFRYCFVNVDWDDKSDNGQTQDVAYSPVQLEIMSSVNNYYAVFNFFDFSDDIPSIDVFDIRSCFEERKEYQFQITFAASTNDGVKYDPKEFIQKAETQIAAAAKVNILRIQEAILEYDSKYVYLTANLLTYPPAKAHFRKFAGKVLHRKAIKSLPKTKTIDGCAAVCLKESNCNSFDFCPDGSGTVSCKLFSPDGKDKLSDDKVCNHYSRVVSGAKNPQEPLVAIGLLKDAVAGGTLKVHFTVQDLADDPDTIQTYTAINLRDDVTITDNVRLTMENNIKKFDRFKTDTTIVASERMRHYAKLSVDDCANICLIEPTYACESFAFCFSQGDCYVAGSHPDQKPEMLEDHTGCSVYNRNYLYRYDKEPGVSIVTIGDKPADATSDTDCAKQCTINDDFLCQSFEYCPQIKECTLSKVHKMDIPDTELKGNVMCDIYFRKYIDDFKMSKGKRVALVNNQVLSDLSEEECAKACMEEESYNCASFDYCANRTECRLTNQHTLNSGQVTLEPSAFCNHFRRKADSYAHNRSVKKGAAYSSSHLTGVALGTLIGSFLFGALFMALYLRRKSTVSI